MRQEDQGWLYALINRANGRLYIGATTSPEHRRRCHQSALRHGRADSMALRQDADRYGASAFTFTLIDGPIPMTMLAEAEQETIAEFRSGGAVYNHARGARFTVSGVRLPGLRAARVSAGMTSRELAVLCWPARVGEQIHAAVNLIRRIEQGGRCRTATMRRLAWALRVHPSVLRGEANARRFRRLLDHPDRDRRRAS